MKSKPTHKMRSIFFLLFFVPLMVSAQKTLSLTGKVLGVKDGSKLALTDLNNPTDTIAKGVIHGGNFVLKGTLKEPLLMALNFGKDQNAILFLENAPVKLTGNVSDLKAVQVTGSATHAAFDAFQKKFNPLFEKLSKINQQLPMTANKDSLIMAGNAVKAVIEKEIDLFLTKYKKSPVSSLLIAITMNLTDDIALTEKRLNVLPASVVSNFYGNFVKQIITEKSLNAIGSKALDFTQADTLGNPVSLSSFRGKYVLLDFWASWCGPCRQENPNVVNTYNKFKAKNFTVLGVSLDRPGQKAKWLQAIHADNLTWTHVSDLQFWSNEVAKQYRIESIPQNYLIGPDGTIVAKNLRGPALESKLCEVLGCN